VLAAKRAGNTGFDVVVATSDQATDDELVSHLRGQSIRVFRGDLQNVRRRILGATMDLDDDDLIVRLTADNPGPDGELIQLVIEEFLRSGVDHIETSGLDRRLPYGMSVEVFRAGGLRRSCAWRDSETDREHVTSALRELGISIPSKIQHANQDLSAFRCTIDTFEDWAVMDAVFGTLSHPVTAHWTEVLDRLQIIRTPRQSTPRPRFVFGTAQLSQPYGSVTKVSPPTRSEAIAMVQYAVANGALIDTARGYGDSEAIIGEALRNWGSERLRVVTKCGTNVTVNDVPSLRDQLIASVGTSLSELDLASPPVVLLHDPSLLHKFDGAAIDVLTEMESRGEVQAVGISVDGPKSLITALQDSRIKVVQFAYNLLDERWHVSEVLAAFKSRPDVDFYCRSVFLQGILVRPPTFWPDIEGVSAPSTLASLERIKMQLGRNSLVELCLSWVCGPNPLRDYLSGVVLGAESLKQLIELFDEFNQPLLSPEEAVLVSKALPTVPEQLLNPALWSLGRQY
jgi:spore coat polysaccharide biosynthesis protein SpsF